MGGGHYFAVARTVQLVGDLAALQVVTHSPQRCVVTSADSAETVTGDQRTVVPDSFIHTNHLTKRNP